MQRLTATVLLGAGLLLSAGTAQAMSQDYINKVLVDTCLNVKKNVPIRLHQHLKENRLKVPMIRERLMCNGETVYNFALTHGAYKTAQVINKGSVTITPIAANTGNKIWVWFD